ncbi:CYTH domain-containing protein [Flavobacterium sp. NKUCC04_CG]|uniref:CYTH domain-containing protein n=1 Tax=Flavobacterium sp. NKUCC04_CG TaxID=2842121 RepID=UPI001C5B347B|nr:CYTH domain-containing protein [Flavobacterium sp. NKUCC04_CG]MBW3518465.1 CYTH domain-containing protein [Flavobacterium sp. NKUCC04_CG]
MIEIERKFRIRSLDFIKESYHYSDIQQGYLNSAPERTVRVRVRDNQGFLTIKGKSNSSGTSRMEWEKEIDLFEAKELLKLCEDFAISKTRYLVKVASHLFEVDVFHGENEGLILAEIELNDENETFIRPEWLGEEVTGDIRFYNSYLSQHPYSKW